LVITVVTLMFVNFAHLTMISSFASSTFLLIFAAINLSALKLRDTINPNAGLLNNALLPLSGFVLSMISWTTLMIFLWRTSTDSVIWIACTYLAIVIAELLLNKHRSISR